MTLIGVRDRQQTFRERMPSGQRSLYAHRLNARKLPNPVLVTQGRAALAIRSRLPGINSPSCKGVDNETNNLNKYRYRLLADSSLDGIPGG